MRMSVFMPKHRSLQRWLSLFGLFVLVGVAQTGRVFAEDALPLTKAVDQGKVSVQAKGNGNYSDISLKLKNETDNDLSVELNGSYFTPPEGSDSQRLGVSHLVDTDGDSTVDLKGGEQKAIKAKAFCIDSTNGVPNQDEDFTLGGDVDDLEDRPFLDQILVWYKNHPDAEQYEVQEAIWSIETNHEEGLNSHYGEIAAGILQQVTGDENPVAKLLELQEVKQETGEKVASALGVALSSLLAAGALSSASGTGGIGSLLSSVGEFFGSYRKEGDPSGELVDNLSVDNLTETILGQGEDLMKTPKLDKNGNPTGELEDTKLSQAWKHSMTTLGILNDANALHKDGYNDNVLQSLGLSTMMNLAANKGMDALAEYGMQNLGTIETFAKLFTPPSAQDILPSNIIKQTVKAGGDVTKAIAQSLGSGEMKPLNDYAQNVAEGKSGLMLEGYAHLGEAFGDLYTAVENEGFVETIKNFGSDLQQMVETGALKDVIYDGMKKLADEAKSGSGADKGIAELSEVAGTVVGTLESEGVVKGSQKLANEFVEDVKTIVKHGDFKKIAEDVGDSAEQAIGIVGTGVKEGSQLLGEYYEEGGGIVGGVKKFGSDCALIWKYLW